MLRATFPTAAFQERGTESPSHRKTLNTRAARRWFGDDRQKGNLKPVIYTERITGIELIKQMRAAAAPANCAGSNGTISIPHERHKLPRPGKRS